jgi:hypothetical protein
MSGYDERLPLRDARATYFRDNGFGDDGGYAKKWVSLRLGPIPFAFPNTSARVRAVRYHDLHHVVTGYRTDLVGEAEIGAWEVASGCAGFAAAWILNLYAMVLGCCAGAPGAVWRAFVRGRRTRNLYRERYDDALLGAELGAVRIRLGLAATAESRPPAATPADRVAFAGWSAVAAALALGTIGIALAPVAFALRAAFG